MFKNTFRLVMVCALSAMTSAYAAPTTQNPVNRLSILKAPTVLSPDAFKGQVKTLDTQNQSQLKKLATDDIAKASEPTPPPALPNTPNANKTKPAATEEAPSTTTTTTTTNTPPPNDTAAPHNEPATSNQNFTGFGDDSSSKSNEGNKSSSGLDIQY